MERKKLLIADDSEMNRAILANMLEQDYEIMEVSDGKEALAALQIYRKDLSALLLDVVMPGMDGFQVLEEMKQHYLQVLYLECIQCMQKESTGN
mgnify:CR=1 FL=1